MLKSMISNPMDFLGTVNLISAKETDYIRWKRIL